MSFLCRRPRNRGKGRHSGRYDENHGPLKHHNSISTITITFSGSISMASSRIPRLVSPGGFFTGDLPLLCPRIPHRGTDPPHPARRSGPDGSLRIRCCRLSRPRKWDLRHFHSRVINSSTALLTPISTIWSFKTDTPSRLGPSYTSLKSEHNRSVWTDKPYDPYIKP